MQVDGTAYAIAEFLGRSYSIRDAATGDIIGVFLLDEDGTRLAGADGIDLPLTIRVAKAALKATGNVPPTTPPGPGISDDQVRYVEPSGGDRRTRDTEPPPASRRT